MRRALLFSGTSDGSRLALCLAGRGWLVTVCTATEYGERSAPRHANIRVHAGRMDRAEMEAFLAADTFEVVIDGTHPYAQAVSENLRGACQARNLPLLRLLRRDQSREGVVEVSTTEEAARFLNTVTGNVLLTTGSKELAAYGAVTDQSRLYARVLSTEESVAQCRALGFEGRRLLAMQGPFSEELNLAMLREIHARWLVTKASGAAGGFQEKLAAARRAGAGVVVIRRPHEEAGHSLRELAELLTGMPEDREVSLVGIGMGAPQGLTGEAAQALEEAQVLFGAERMLEAVADYPGEKIPEYRAGPIAEAILRREESRFAVVLSGDPGFYSGAAQLRARLEQVPYVKVKTVCGVTSAAWLCARLGKSWQDAAILSLHGRSGNLAGAVRRYGKVFAIAGDNVGSLLEALCACGLGSARVWVGSNLSYENESIVHGLAAELRGRAFPALSCLLVEYDGGGQAPVTPGVPDEVFVRGAVPMTKEEVRAVSLSKLRLTEDAVVYDVGAGTGSVSVEAALLAWRGRVYAIERKEEGCALIRENCRRFGTQNVEVVEGSAPEALEALPPPTHVFLGGTGGTMKKTICAVLEKNPKARVVLNAIALETLSQVLDLARERSIQDLEMVQVSTARARALGPYHMMNGGNPVFVCSFGGSPWQVQD